MTETEYREMLAAARVDAHADLARLLVAWRRELWPNPNSDPISREARLRRLRRELAVEAYWGAAVHRRPMYGGICGA